MAPRSAITLYWVCTSFVSLTALGAGIMDVLHLQPLFGLLLHLGYPSYFATILGVWKVLGAIVRRSWRDRRPGHLDRGARLVLVATSASAAGCVLDFVTGRV